MHVRWSLTNHKPVALCNIRRTKNNKGVTIASQRRYIHYLADILNGQGPRQPRPVVMQSIHLSMECSADLVIAVYQRVEAMSEPQLVCCNMPTKGAPEPEATVRGVSLITVLQRCSSSFVECAWENNLSLPSLSCKQPQEYEILVRLS
jgi:hypothetical protein